MILFFGTRPGKRKTFPLHAATCTHCGQAGTLTAEVLPHYVHLFWIPIYRLRPATQVHCSHCLKGYGPRNLSPEMRRELAAAGA